MSILVPCLSFGEDWTGINVNVEADYPVRIDKRLIYEGSGFHRLKVVLSNEGKSTLTIESIDIKIPIEHAVGSDHQILYGSSCMGRRPMLRETVGEQGAKSYSYMYEMVQLDENQYVFAGSLSWRVFLPVLSIEDNAFIVHSEGEGKQLKPGQTVEYEQIVLSNAKSWLALLNDFGDAIAVENGVNRVKDEAFAGWATWDYYGRVFYPKDIHGNIDQLNDLYAEANLIQIDGGWWTERGDYTSVRETLPGGIKVIADRIRADGKTAGLHFDGFRADAASQIYKTHPEYFLHDQDGNVIMEVKPKTERVMNYIYFDYSHPGARAHIAECVRVMKEEWGIRYFKVDFMRYGLESEVLAANKNVKEIVAYDPAITGIERFRLGMKTIREAIGPENYFLGCSAVFGPCIGFVDGMRTGGDVHPRFEAFPERSLANTGNFYLSGKVFNGDCDYLVFREAADEDKTIFQSPNKFGGSLPMNEARMWADYNKMYGNCRLHSDNLMTLREERKALVREVFESAPLDRTVPLDPWTHAADKTDGFELLLGERDSEIFLGIFNWETQQKAYDLSAFGLRQSFVIDGRQSQILQYKGKLSFEELSEVLINEFN